MTKRRPTIGDADQAARRRPSTDEDTAAFRAAVRDVKPLKHPPRTTVPGTATGPVQASVLAKSRSRERVRKTHAVTPDLDESMPLIAVPWPAADRAGGPGSSDLRGAAAAIGAADSLSYQRAGVRTQIMRRLKRGLIPVEDELDLHGLCQSAARDLLAEFLAFGRAAGLRCVRVIHGKGYRSGARGPILKIAVDQWLRRHGDVMAFTSARPIDGGTGAVYVLLRA